MKRFVLMLVSFAAAFYFIDIGLVDARPLRRTKAVARTGPVIGGTKAKAKVKTHRIRRISDSSVTPKQAVESAAPGVERWSVWHTNSPKDNVRATRQNDNLQ